MVFRISKPVKYLSSALCFLFLLVIFARFYTLSSYHFRLPKDPEDTTIRAPLLGSEESQTALWFPPKGESFGPQVAAYNTKPPNKSPLRTPLLIAFTRNHQLLEQTVLSYIAAGWPREDIIVVDNSGTMDANNEGILSRSNPFFLDYDLFRSTYGVSIMQTPTLFTFAQLMNLYLRVAIAQRWSFFFWSHMDVAVLGDESATPYESFYQRVLAVLTELAIYPQQDGRARGTGAKENWAIKFFAYDWLTLVNVQAWRTIGQWDTFIPYYTGDCDAYSRLALHGFTKGDAKAGHIFDLSGVVSNPKTKFFPAHLDEGLNSTRFQALKQELGNLMKSKWDSAAGESRNSWQDSKAGEVGEPWTYNPRGFQKMWWDTANFGRTLYEKKWGSSECRLEDHGVTLRDQFTGFKHNLY